MPAQPVCPFRHSADVHAELKWVLDCPHSQIVIKIEWFQPGSSESWRDTYVVEVKHALADFGADLHADKVKISVVSVPRNGPEYNMAMSNHKAFVNRLRAANAAKKAKEEKEAKEKAEAQQSTADAASALVALPVSPAESSGSGVET